MFGLSAFLIGFFLFIFFPGFDQPQTVRMDFDNAENIFLKKKNGNQIHNLHIHMCVSCIFCFYCKRDTCTNCLVRHMLLKLIVKRMKSGSKDRNIVEDIFLDYRSSPRTNISMIICFIVGIMLE